MKKMLIYLLVISLLSLSISSCSSAESQEKYTIKLCDFSDSVLSAGLYQEYKLTKDDYVDESVAPTVKMNFAGLNFEGTYNVTTHMAYDNYMTHRYLTAENDSIYIRDDGKVVRFKYGPNRLKTLREIEETDIVYTEADCHDVAYDFFENVLGLDPSEYRTSVEYIETYSSYNYTFSKWIGDFKTSEYISIRVTQKNGLIYSYFAHLLDKIPADAQVNFDIEEIERQTTARLDDIYADQKNNFDEIEYVFDHYTVSLDDDGNYILVITVGVDRIHRYSDNLISNIGECLKFVAWEN